MHPIRAVLFDLDGTILDTAPDLIYSLNQLREEHHLPALPLSTVRSLAGLGSKHLIKHSFGIDENNSSFNGLRERFLALYEQHLADATQLFPHIEKVLTHLDQHHFPWGIVTNKLTLHTTALLKAMNLDHRPACVVCGDSLPTYKPDPGPILYACQLLKTDPKHCIYVGDTSIDVRASKAAGTKSLVVLYGYRHENEDPYTWQADGYVNEPDEIIDWILREHP